MSTENPTNPVLLISNKSYDVLKEVTTVWLPALGTLYFTVAQVWGLPFAEQVVGTITAIVVFFGLVLKISSSSYSKVAGNYVTPSGSLVINTSDPDKDTYLLQLDSSLSELKGKSTLTLQVVEETGDDSSR